MAIDRAVDSATPREASSLSESYSSDCMAVIAAPGMAVHRYTLLTTIGDRGVRRSSRISPGKISSRSAQERSSCLSFKWAGRRVISRAPMTNMVSGVVVPPSISSASLRKPGSVHPVKNSVRPITMDQMVGLVSKRRGCMAFAPPKK